MNKKRSAKTLPFVGNTLGKLYDTFDRGFVEDHLHSLSSWLTHVSLQTLPDFQKSATTQKTMVGSDGKRPNQGVFLAQNWTENQILFARNQITKCLQERSRIRLLCSNSCWLAFMTPSEKEKTLSILLSQQPSNSKAKSLFALLSSCTSQAEWEKVIGKTEPTSIALWLQGTSYAEITQFLLDSWEQSQHPLAFFQQPLEVSWGKWYKLLNPHSSSKNALNNTLFFQEGNQHFVHLSLQIEAEPRSLWSLAFFQSKTSSHGLDWKEEQKKLHEILLSPQGFAEEFEKWEKRLASEYSMQPFEIEEVFTRRLLEILDYQSWYWVTKGHLFLSQTATFLSKAEQELFQNRLETEVSFLSRLRFFLQKENQELLTKSEEVAEFFDSAQLFLEELKDSKQNQEKDFVFIAPFWLFGIQSLRFFSRISDKDMVGLEELLVEWQKQLQSQFFFGQKGVAKWVGQAFHFLKESTKWNETSFSEKMNQLAHSFEKLEKQWQHGQKLVTFKDLLQKSILSFSSAKGKTASEKNKDSLQAVQELGLFLFHEFSHFIEKSEAKTSSLSSPNSPSSQETSLWKWLQEQLQREKQFFAGEKGDSERDPDLYFALQNLSQFLEQRGINIQSLSLYGQNLFQSFTRQS